MSTFGERLKALRQNLGLTQKQFAELIGSTERGVRRYEIGDGVPAYDIILSILNNVDVPVSELIGSVKLDSSVIDEIAYKDNSLYVKFKDNGWYKYPRVPEDLFKKLLKSKSHGAFLNSEIKKLYRGFRCPAPTID